MRKEKEEAHSRRQRDNDVQTRRSTHITSSSLWWEQRSTYGRAHISNNFWLYILKVKTISFLMESYHAVLYADTSNHRPIAFWYGVTKMTSHIYRRRIKYYCIFKIIVKRVFLTADFCIGAIENFNAFADTIFNDCRNVTYLVECAPVFGAYA